MTESSEEKHHLLPSGEWEGFYLYPGNSHKHRMSMVLHFRQGNMHGTGFDDIGAFVFSGNYNIGTLLAEWAKVYHTHKIAYSGHIDENGIWGHWQNEGNGGWGLRGGFHIWPVKKDNETAAEVAEEVDVEKLLLKS